MRIRKCASKLLGSASSYAPAPESELWASSSSPAAPWDATASTSGLLCELNRSPWDLMLSDLELANLQDDGDGRGIMGNGVKLEQDQEDDEEDQVLISTIARREEKKKAEKKKKVAKKKKEVEKNKDTTADTVSICKKTDGKGWHCKRPAHYPHSLCQYHLAQLRSYSTNNGASKANTPRDVVDSKSRKKKTGDDDANTNLYYYYYSGFGPWRGKRRGGSRGDNSGGGSESVGNEREEEEGEDREESGAAREVYDDSVAVAGGDEESNGEDDGIYSDGSDDDDDDDDDDDKMRNLRRKRGRKPVKARSLKSLL